MRAGMVLTLFFVLIPAHSGPSLTFGNEYRDVTPDYAVSLPDDLYYRENFRVQWWYFTGHLTAESGMEYGYELVFFAVGVQRRQFASNFGMNTIIISHFALSDIAEGTYFYRDKSDGQAFGLSGASKDRLAVWVDGDRLEGSMREFHLRASGQGHSIDLVLVPLKPYVLNGEEGYSRKSEDSSLLASIYFSNTHLATRGRLKISGREIKVTGKSWFDREISSRRADGFLSGWDWFAIQLIDGREVMLYLLRKEDGSIDIFSSGTVVYPDGNHRILNSEDFAVGALGSYRSKKTNTRYPSGWWVKVPSENLTLTVNPLIQDQEFVAPYSTWNHYWEGACLVDGSARGRAYVELTGYPEVK